MVDNCQDTIFGGFAPNSQTVKTLLKALGKRTVLSGSVSRGKKAAASPVRGKPRLSSGSESGSL